MLARHIDVSVIHMQSVVHRTAAAEIITLSQCERMAEMEWVLKKESEIAPLITACAMPCLNDLRLSWL